VCKYQANEPALIPLAEIRPGTPALRWLGLLLDGPPFNRSAALGGPDSPVETGNTTWSIALEKILRSSKYIRRKIAYPKIIGLPYNNYDTIIRFNCHPTVSIPHQV
jgi:hypothetical protein